MTNQTTQKVLPEFQEVRDWKEIRGIGGNNTLSLDKQLQGAFQRTQQEISEVHESIVLEDWEEFQDAIGDSIVTLINLAALKGFNAEDCLKKAFGVIRLRKGLIKEGSGEFVRYGKLQGPDKDICDAQQGNKGNEYFKESSLRVLNPVCFKRP